MGGPVGPQRAHSGFFAERLDDDADQLIARSAGIRHSRA